jgi:hypothetical protein
LASNPSTTIKLLDKTNVEYIKSQLETGDPFRTKKALQLLCKLYREGSRIRPEQLTGVEQSIVGLLLTRPDDEKVRRWSLNAIARLGRGSFCEEAVLHVIEKYDDEPQTTAAGIAALFRLNKSASKLLARMNFDQQMLTLAALQHVEANKLDMKSLPIDVERASPDLLRLGLVLVGLDRAPKNLLNPRHDNPAMVRALGKHNDPIVSQYSVWAVTENPKLSIEHLGLDLKDIEALPDNVRTWVFQLIAMSAETFDDCKEYIELAVADKSPEVRGGLAIGLKDKYLDGLDSVVLDWITRESDQSVQEYLTDHIVRHSDRSAAYFEMASEIYRDAGNSSLKRQRMEANATGLPLYSTFKLLAAGDLGDLFRNDNKVNNTYNFGDIQGGVVSFGGTASNSGQITTEFDNRQQDLIISELSKAELELLKIAKQRPEAAETLAAVQEAKALPSKSKVGKALKKIEGLEKNVLRVHKTGTAIVAIAKAIAAAAGL